MFLSIVEELQKIRRVLLLKGKDILTLEEVALYTGYSIDHIHKLTQSGRLTHYKPGGKTCFVHIEDLKKYLQQSKVESTCEIANKALKHFL